MKTPYTTWLVILLLGASNVASNADSSGAELAERHTRVRRATSVTGDIAMCYDCDDKCVAYISQFSDDVNDYFAQLTATITQIFEESGFPLTFSVKMVRLLHQEVHLRSYVSQSDTNKRNTANNNYWNFNFNMLQSSERCDIGLFTSRDDFFTTQNFGSFATYMSMCTNVCYGLIELTSNINTMASRVSHELGHTMGLSHYDGTLPEFLKQVTAVKTACQTNDCPDPTGNCVMMSYLPSPPPQRFSSCAKAMFDHWASTHDTDCVEPASPTTSQSEVTTASYDLVTDSDDATVVTAIRPVGPTSKGAVLPQPTIFLVFTIVILVNVW